MTWVLRLKKEVNRFLASFDPDNNEHVLVLLFYYRCFHNYPKVIKKIGEKQLLEIDATVNALPHKRIEESAVSFNFDIYIDSFIALYEDWKILLVPDIKMVDVAVHLLVLDSGYTEACLLAGEHVVSDKQFDAQIEKLYRLQDHPIWSCMHEEFGHRYRDNYVDGDEVLWL